MLTKNQEIHHVCWQEFRSSPNYKIKIMLGNFTWHFHSAPTNIEFWPEYSSTLRNNYSLKFITEAL